MSPRKARGILRTVAKTLNRSGERSAILDFPFTLKRMDAAETREFLLRALALADYGYPVYKTMDKEKKTLGSVAVTPAGAFAGATAAEARDAEALARIAAFVRDLGNTPSNDLVPRDFARRVSEEARARGLRAKVLDKKAIRREKMGGLLAVNRGSAEEPRVVVLEWKGGKKADPPARVRRQGRHVRLGRHLDQARREDGRHEVGHDGRRDRDGDRPRGCGPEAARQRRSASPLSPRTSRPGAPTSRATSSASATGRRPRSTTRTPRDA